MEQSTIVPNHHADHPGFAGPSGFAAAVSFLYGRDRAADLAISLADLRAGERVVDIGCGPGVAVERARSHGAEVIGVDPATVMLRVARTRWRSDAAVDWRIGSAESLPVDDGWAHVAWSLSTVHHWGDLNAGLAEVVRVLQPGGRFVATERHILDPSADGTASHGWTVAQADLFAEHCRAIGFAEVVVERHEGETTVMSVLARLPG